jgi:hypothetical protein
MSASIIRSIHQIRIMTKEKNPNPKKNHDRSELHKNIESEKMQEF